MARNISIIYDSIISTKDSRDELIKLNSTSQAAIYKLWAYVVAVSIYSHELLWDLFRDEINETITLRVNGTSEWYASKAIEYQYGDDLLTLGDGAYLGYEPILEDNQIVTRCAYLEDSDGVLNLKVAKGDASLLSPLDDGEIGGLTQYFSRIKFAGTRINIISIEPDEIQLDNNVTIFHSGVRADADVLLDVGVAMDEYLTTLPFDGQFYVEAFRDSIQLVADVVDVYIVDLKRTTYISGSKVEDNPIIRRQQLDAGYAIIQDKSLINIQIES